MRLPLSVFPPGEVWVESARGLDFEDTPRLRLVIQAETVTSTSFMAINLVLQDVNDNLPRFQLQNYVAYMKEAQGYETPIIRVTKNIKLAKHCKVNQMFSPLKFVEVKLNSPFFFTLFTPYSGCG